VDAVENSAGLNLFPEQLKAMAKPLCQVSLDLLLPLLSLLHPTDHLTARRQTTKCQVVVRRFDDANKKLGNGGGGGGKGGRGRSNSA
jgi:hypothetical protein